MLRTLGVLVYSPPLHYAVEQCKQIASGHSWEVQIRGCTIWYELDAPSPPEDKAAAFHIKATTTLIRAVENRAVELIRREILRQHPEAEATGVNAVLIDFLLYDLAKEREAAGECFVPTDLGARGASIMHAVPTACSFLAAIGNPLLVALLSLAVRSSMRVAIVEPGAKEGIQNWARMPDVHIVQQR